MIVDINEILKMIPHRYPILLVDRILELEPNESIVGLKNVTFNEPHFMGHFPSKPIMPGVLIIEAMAQTSAVMVMKSFGEEAHGKLVYFMSIENAKFRKPVEPGDTMHLHVKKVKERGNIWKLEGIAKVDGKKVAEASFSAMIMDEK